MKISKREMAAILRRQQRRAQRQPSERERRAAAALAAPLERSVSGHPTGSQAAPGPDDLFAGDRLTRS